MTFDAIEKTDMPWHLVIAVHFVAISSRSTMSHDPSRTHSRGQKPVTAVTSWDISHEQKCRLDGAQAPPKRESAAQLIVDRLLRECLRRKSLVE